MIFHWINVVFFFNFIVRQIAFAAEQILFMTFCHSWTHNANTASSSANKTALIIFVTEVDLALHLW